MHRSILPLIGSGASLMCFGKADTGVLLIIFVVTFWGVYVALDRLSEYF